jgi:3-hydroxybutyryl-CoA dehydratase
MTAAIEGRTLEDLSVGDSAERSFTVAGSDIDAFAAVSHDRNPVHLDEAYAATTAFKGRIAHGMLSAAYISAVLGEQMPGPGSVYVSQSIRFKRPVRIGDTVVVKVAVTEIVERTGKVTLSTTCQVNGKTVADGEAEVLIPRTKTPGAA